MDKKIIKIGSITVICIIILVMLVMLLMLVMFVIKYCSPHPIPPESVNTRSCPPQTNIVNRPGTLYSVYTEQTQGLNQQDEQAVYQTRVAENTLPSGQRQETRQTPGHPPDSDEPPSYEIAIHM
eukprot:GFUD01057671.1.p1 GENE.GFUD01057671.1~~GFUD01057671.1.p1  ORF type:complete len:131 (-),score=31.90 GFUD01057671.1:288-659(-)